MPGTNGAQLGRAPCKILLRILLIVRDDLPSRSQRTLRGLGIDGCWFRVEKIDGTPVPPCAEVRVIAFGTLPESVAENHRYRLAGAVADALTFGGMLQFSFRTSETEDLGAAPPVAPSSGDRVELAKSEGKRVAITGTLWSRNGFWWFEYGEDVHLGGPTGRNLTFPIEWHGRRARVVGLVKHQLRIPIDWGRGNSDSDLSLCPVIFDAKVSHADGADPGDLDDESYRFRPLYKSSPKKRGGVFGFCLPHSSS